MGNSFHFTTLDLALRYFPPGAAAAYVLGDEALLWDMAQSWEMLMAFGELERNYESGTDRS